MAATQTPAGIRAGSPYWPSLDGVRGLFMVVIFAYHAYPPLVPGAGIAVDAFFVMSAFLITTLLVAEHQRTGRLDLLRFYRRRALRLLPAMLVVVPVAALVAWLAIPGQRTEVLPSVRSVLLYYANFRAAAHPGQMSVFLPTWSLSPEEQIYLVWPTLLLALLLLRTRPRALVAVVAGLLAVSTVWLQVAYETGTSETAIAYRPDLRISGILIGTLVGLLHAYDLVPGGARRLTRTATLVGTAFVGYYLFRPLTLPRSTIITLAIVAACAAFGALVLQQVRWPVPAFSAVLEWRPLVWTGRASYVLYLLHVPVLRTLSAVLDRPSWPVRLVLGGVITLGLGAAVHVWVERPALRLKERRTRALV
jgi:peptidoglycan/LPS O-acetylase OafA/YrhL